MYRFKVKSLKISESNDDDSLLSTKGLDDIANTQTKRQYTDNGKAKRQRRSHPKESETKYDKPNAIEESFGFKFDKEELTMFTIKIEETRFVELLMKPPGLARMPMMAYNQPGHVLHRGMNGLPDIMRRLPEHVAVYVPINLAFDPTSRWHIDGIKVTADSMQWTRKEKPIQIPTFDVVLERHKAQEVNKLKEQIQALQEQVNVICDTAKQGSANNEATVSFCDNDKF
jgi:hypothetical protein